MGKRACGQARAGAPAGSQSVPKCGTNSFKRATRHDEAAVWLYAPRLRSVAGQNRAKPRVVTVAKSTRRHVWLERRPARAPEAAIATFTPIAVEIPVELPLAA